ncbi:hypothetical protein Dimus_016058, partial [Dionaea muscipula]
MPKGRARRPKPSGRASRPALIEEESETSLEDDGSIPPIDDDATGDISMITEDETLEYDGETLNCEVDPLKVATNPMDDDATSEADNDAVVTEFEEALEDAIDDSEAILGFPPLPDPLGSRISSDASESTHGPNQDKQRPSELVSDSRRPVNEMQGNRGKRNGSSGNAPNLPPHAPSLSDDHFNSSDQNNSKSQWSHLFANN